VFRLSGLPLSATTAASAKGSPAGRAEARFQGKHVLVIDDDPEALRATADLLTHWGCRTTRAMGAGDAFSGDAPDLIVCDYEFPNGDTGLDILAQAAAAFGGPVNAVVISGNSSPEVQQAVAAAGLLLIHKPVQPAQLRSALLQAFVSQAAAAGAHLGGNPRLAATAEAADRVATPSALSKAET